MPLTSKTFSQLIDFTRTSAATYVDQLGRIVPTPVSLNLLTFTQEFDNAAWGKQGASVTSNVTSAPDGTITADALVEDTSAGTHDLSASVTITTGQIHTVTFFLKASGRSLVRVMQTWNGTADRVHADFDLASGTVGAAVVTGTAAAVGAPVITSFGNGWYRCQVSGSCPTGTAVLAYARLMSASGVVSYTGSGTSGILIWGAQLEQTPDANLTLGSELNSAAVPFTVFRDGSTNTPSPTLMNTVSGKLYRVQLNISVNTSTQTSTLRINGGGTSVGFPLGATGSVIMYLTAASSGVLTVQGDAAGVNFTVTSASIREVTAASPSTYTRNFGGRFPPRFDYDPVTLAPRGLLVEEQRTNLLVRSEEFGNASWQKSAASISANVATSPDGTVDADALVEDSTTADHVTFQPAPFVSGTAYTVTVYAKADTRTRLNIVCVTGLLINGNFDLSNGTVISAANGTASITPAGGGWYRCQMVATAGATTNGNIQFRLISTGTTTNYAGDGTSRLFLWGAQLEAGAFATSYIPTVASQVTRTADSAAITGANFSPWYNQSEGTLVAEVQKLSPSGTAAFAWELIGSSSNFSIRTRLGTDSRMQAVDGGVTQVDGQLATPVPTAASKYALAYKANDFAGSAGGAAAVTDTSVTVPAVTSLSIGSASVTNLYIRSIRYYPTRLTNAQLQALTA
jgi:hypothetical protein